MNQVEIALLYDYNYWGNQQILRAASGISPAQYTAKASFPYGSLRGTLVHMLDAEASWRQLLQYGRMDFGVLQESDFPTVVPLEARWREEEAVMRGYLAGLDDAKLEGIVTYTTDEGNKRERVLWHCLYHVVNHATQHRSEAAAMLTDYGRSPGELDFTVFLNERKQEAG